MDNNVVALVFFLLFGAAAFFAGAGWMRNRARTLWEEGYEQGMERGASTMFKISLRAQMSKVNNASRRFLPAAGRALGRSKPPVGAAIGEETTMIIDFPRPHPRHLEREDQAA